MRIAIIGGTGMEERLSQAGLLRDASEVSPETPFGSPSAPIVVGQFSGGGETGAVEIALLARHGRGHTLPPHRIPWRANIYALKSLDVTHIVATGAVGSLREHIRPGELVLCDQLIDRTTARITDRSFFDCAAVHVEFADPCCSVTRAWLSGASGDTGVTTHKSGAYVAVDGPSFSTRAESLMHRAMGADVVGMTALPEARLAREAEIAYALIALTTDYDCWRERYQPDSPASLIQEIIANLGAASDAAWTRIETALRDTSPLRSPSPAHTALDLAVWTDPSLIPAGEQERLRPILARRLGLDARPPDAT